MSWIHPSFDVFGGSGHRKIPRKMETTSCRINKISCNTIWCEEYEPHKKEDLAVNRRKIEELETWLCNAFMGRFGKAPIALLSGPSGSGKTATVKVLSKYMDFSIKEWITPGKVAIFKEDFEGSINTWYESQVSSFEEYLFKASRYPCLMGSTDTSKCIVLVEDIPNVYIGDTTLLEKTLQKYSEIGLCPLILICSTGPPDFNLERILFKEEMVKELKIFKISFNPASKTLLRNALKRIAQEGRKKNSNTFQNIPEVLINEAVEMSNCDIRSAVNQFQYILCGRIGTKKKLEVPLEKNDPVIGRDEFHDIFRCIGRVLYCKRVNISEKDGEAPKERFLYNPEEIVGSVSSVPNLFLNLLNENYISIFTDMKMIAEASDYLSYSDVLMSKRSDRDTEVNYSLYLAISGLMKCSKIENKRTWLPLRSSKSKHALAACEEKLNQCLLYFPEKLSERRTLMKECLPYFAKLDLSKTKQDKKKFIMSFAEWSSRGVLACSLSCEENKVTRDIIAEHLKEGSLNEEKNKFSNPEDETDTYIEEYDSSWLVETGLMRIKEVIYRWKLTKKLLE